MLQLFLLTQCNQNSAAWVPNFVPGAHAAYEHVLTYMHACSHPASNWTPFVVVPSHLVHLGAVHKANQ